jgi:hypothetical protein
VKRRAHGFRSFSNFRLRVIAQCGWSATINPYRPCPQTLNQTLKMAEREGFEPRRRLDAKSLANVDFVEFQFLMAGNKEQAGTTKGGQNQDFGQPEDNLLEARMDEIQRFVPKFPVNREMSAVGRYDHRLRKDFGQPYHGCIAEVHFRILGGKRPQMGHLVRQKIDDPDRPGLDHAVKLIDRVPRLSELPSRLRDDGLACY